MDPVEACPRSSGVIIQYQIIFTSGSIVVAKSVSPSKCTAGVCGYNFKPASNGSVYDNVSVAAENVVGVGAARTCTTQTISELITLEHQCVVLQMSNLLKTSYFVVCGTSKLKHHYDFLCKWNIFL